MLKYYHLSSIHKSKFNYDFNLSLLEVEVEKLTPIRPYIILSLIILK